MIAEYKDMDSETYNHFRYEIALGADIPMPKPKLDVFPQSQFSLQQFLLTVCKQQIGALGKREGRWSFGGDAAYVKLSSRTDITQLLDFAEKLGIVEPADPGDDPDYIPFKLSKAYWTRFDKYGE